ncbi:MAG: hypothetical protein Q9213_004173 [Squamulea squamosa]
MRMTFFASITTPLFSSAWSPGSTGAYAGTCIFLIIFAAIYRLLVAGKHLLEHRWLDIESKRRYVTVRDMPTERERIHLDIGSKNATLISEQGVEEDVKVIRRSRRPVTPWRFSVDGPRAVYATVTAGVGYLLMLAVMTMNIGFFLSVLGGTFLGELAFGRYTQQEEHELAELKASISKEKSNHFLLPIKVISMMKLIFFTLSLLASIVSAHFTLDFPKAREADEEQQGTFPCGGGGAVSNERTAWPIAGGSIQLTLEHSHSAVQALLAVGNDPGSNFNVVLVPTIQEQGIGKFCLSDVKIPENLGLRDGDNATIQVVTDSEATGGLYHCADITLSSSNSSASASQCTNGQGVRTTQYSGKANANGTDSSSPPPASTSGTATSSPTGASPAASPSSAAGKREFAGVTVLGLLAAWTLWL